MLVVIILFLVLVGITVPVAMRVAAGDRVRDAASTVQVALASVRDRAMASRTPRGIRLIPSDQDRTLVRELLFVRQANPLTDQGGVAGALVMHGPAQQLRNGALVNTGSIEWPATLNNATDVQNALFGTVVLIGVDPNALRQLPSVVINNATTYFGTIRFNQTGRERLFWATDASLSYDADGNGPIQPNPKLYLDEPLTLPLPFGTMAQLDPGLWPTPNQPYDLIYRNTSFSDPTIATGFKIELGNVPDEDNAPVQLPDGAAIDLGYIDPNWGISPAALLDGGTWRLSRIEPDLALRWDIMVSPTGQVIGSQAALPQVILWVREQLAGVDDVAVPANPAARMYTGRQKLVRATNPGRHLIVTLFSRTGFVQTGDPVFVDVLRADGTAGSDGYYDFPNYYDNVPQGTGTGL
jgi:hypothetical protein